MLESVRMRLPIIPALLLTASSLALTSFTGCSRPAFPMPGASGDAAEQRRELDEVRTEIQQIPLPSKSRYLAVKSLTSWENPYLTVQGNMVTLHVTLADANPTDLGQGGLLRPVGARRQDLNVRTADLPAAINAIPETAWPYGRVVAVEEAHDAPQSARPQLRRNMEGAMKTLNDIGVVVYEWQEGGPSLR
jgi:hypothetical protein